MNFIASQDRRQFSEAVLKSPSSEVLSLERNLPCLAHSKISRMGQHEINLELFKAIEKASFFGNNFLHGTIVEVSENPPRVLLFEWVGWRLESS